MPKKPRNAKAQHVRNHKRAAKRQAARNDRHSGKKTLPMSQRGTGMSLQSYLARLFSANQVDAAANVVPKGTPKRVIQYSQHSRRHQKVPSAS